MDRLGHIELQVLEKRKDTIITRFLALPEKIRVTGLDASK
jgi:hypothetical protein